MEGTASILKNFAPSIQILLICDLLSALERVNWHTITMENIPLMRGVWFQRWVISFVLGEVGAYGDLVNHPTIKDSHVDILDTLPSCSTCWNAPYCGVRPLHNYMDNKDLFAQRPLTLKCKENMKISELLFSRLLHDKDGTMKRIFNRWTLDRPRQQE